MKSIINISILTLAVTAMLFTSCTQKTENNHEGMLIIKDQGSFTVGGTVVQHPGEYNSQYFNNWQPYQEGQTFHGDHAYVFYQIPDKAKQLPIVFLHGAGQSAQTWETTADGREGFQNIFLRRGFSTYLVDQPRRGRAGRSTVAATLDPIADEQMWYEIFRIGNWPNLHEGVQFPSDKQSLENFFRQMTPNTGPFDAGVITRSMVELFDKTGPAILVTHSQGGLPGWMVAAQSDNVKAVVAYEPGTYLFPQGELPETITGLTGALNGVEVPMEQFNKLISKPIVMYFGDNIGKEVSNELGKENWRTRLTLGKLFVEAVNRHGGDATLVELPEIGIYGNTHFLMSDLNNVEIADQLSKWLNEKGLDK